LQRWCVAQGVPRGEALTLEQIWALAKAWYGDRMTPEFRGRTVEAAARIFGQIGLSSDFWYLPGGMGS
jgi:hypothetical protein